MSGSSSFPVAYSQIWTDYPRPMFANPDIDGGSEYVYGLTEFDVHPNYRNNRELLKLWLETYSVPVMDSYSYAKAILPEGTMDNVLDGSMPQDRWMALGFDRYGSDSMALDEVPAEFTLWAQLGEEYELRKLAGTHLEWEQEIMVDPLLGLFENGQITNAEAYAILNTAEIRDLVHRRIQSILMADIATLGLADQFHIYNYQPTFGGSTETLLAKSVLRAMAFMDVLSTLRKPGIATNTQNWDVVNQAEIIQKMLAKHPEIGGGYDQLIFEAIYYRPNLLVLPDNLAKIKPDAMEAAIYADYLVVEMNILKTKMTTTGLATLEGTKNAPWSKVELVSVDGRYPSTDSGDDVDPLRFTQTQIKNYAKEVVENPEYITDGTNVLGAIILNLIGNGEYLSGSDIEGNKITLETMRRNILNMMKTPENTVADISATYPTTLDNNGNWRSRIDRHRSSEVWYDAKLGAIIFSMDVNAYQSRWGAGTSNHVRTFLMDWRNAFVAQGIGSGNKPMYLEFPKQWYDWINGIDVSGGPDPTKFNDAGYPMYQDANGKWTTGVKVRMKNEYRGSANRDLSFEALIFHEVTDALGIRPIYKVKPGDKHLLDNEGLKVGREISNMKKDLVLNPEEAHLSIVNLIQSTVGRNVRPYDGGSANADLFSSGTLDESKGVFEDWHTVDDGIKLRINEHGNIVVDGAPDVIYGPGNPQIDLEQWDSMKQTFADAGIPWTIGNFWGHIAVTNDAGQHQSFIRFKDLSGDGTGLIDPRFMDGDLDTREFEDLGHFMAFYALPREQTLKNFANKGFVDHRPLPGAEYDDIVIIPEGSTKLIDPVLPRLENYRFV